MADNDFYLFRDIPNGYRYYYTQLNKSEQKVYNKILNAIWGFSNSISVEGLSSDQIQNIYQCIRSDNPCLFYVESLTYQYSPIAKGGSVIPKYRFDKGSVYSTFTAIANTLSPLIKECLNKQDIEKEKIVHDYFARIVKYDNSFKASSYECVGPILFRKGVCEGISKAVKLVLDFLNINCIVVHGEAVPHQNPITTPDNLHTWNIVNIQNCYYHLDVTYDLTIQSFGVLRYDYFNLSDEEIFADHKVHSGHIPKCNFTGNYYVKNSMLMQNQEMFRKYLTSHFQCKEYDVVFKLPPVTNITKTCQKVMSNIQKVMVEMALFNKQYHLSYNETQFVFHLHIV